MNVEEFKAMVKVCHHHEAKVVVSTQLLLDVIAELEGAQFAAASHLRTVEQQAKIIAGMQAAPIQSGDVRNQALEEAADALDDAGAKLQTEDKSHDFWMGVGAAVQAGEIAIRALASTHTTTGGEKP